MNERDIKRLIRIVEESGIDELEVTRWGRSVRIVKRSPNGAEPPSGPGVHVVPVPDAGRAAAPESGPGAAAAPAGPDVHVVRSPMVGTLYRAPSPEAPPYVEVGSRVRRGQTLCILEAMKLMNEIEAEVDGVVRAVLAENGEPVEYGQPLFELELA
jgi:acetyl-CoA carboxylase biotin carboxyl carrier protein